MDLFDRRWCTPLVANGELGHRSDEVPFYFVLVLWWVIVFCSSG